MKFTLKDYQEEAARDVLINLGKAKRRWHEDADKHAFSLTATTGAGKTVMAAAVFEALFFGNDDYDFEPDPGAVVVWFSDDPSLNEQSRSRLMEASDRLTVSDLVNVGNSFSREKFDAGKIYFLNTQKLSRGSLLVRGSDPEDPALEKDARQFPLMPDMRSQTIWETIQNTVEDPDLTLYLLLDEAHRGMRDDAHSSADGKPTIVKQLINGKGGIPGIPIVWGISATVDRFNVAIAGMEGLATLPNVVVDSKKVQESGLLKDTINLDVPDAVGDYETVLLRRGAAKASEITKEWDEYARQESGARVVVPLLVLQVPNSPDHGEIGVWLDVIFDAWPDLPYGSIANVFGEHRVEEFGRHSARYISPERVEESHWIRVLVAKDAISTGWDCPRAEVMVSFRAAADRTHITQLLGRMIRTPLARRIPGNERLNSVDCLLPHFNRTSVEAVVDALMTGSDPGEELPGRRVLINPREMRPNPGVSDAVWDKLLALPSQTLPKRQARPVKRLTALAHELSADGLLPDAGKLVHRAMHAVLDAERTRYARDIEEAREAILIVEGTTVAAEAATGDTSLTGFTEDADFSVIEEAYKRAGRVLTPDIARTYSDHLALSLSSSDDEYSEDDLIEAHTVVAAISRVSAIQGILDREAEKLSSQLLDEYRAAIKRLTDERQDVYRDIREMSADPLDVELARPKTWLQPATLRDESGGNRPLPRYERHLLCDDDGLFPEDLNAWERTVVAAELSRSDNMSWYRNPARATQDSLGVTYEGDGEIKLVRPDFIFFAGTEPGTVVADLIDPHGYHLADALPKLKGLVRYAEVHAQVYRRIETVAELSDGYRCLNLKDPLVQEAVRSAASARSLYEGAMARDYPS